MGFWALPCLKSFPEFWYLKIREDLVTYWVSGKITPSVFLYFGLIHPWHRRWFHVTDIINVCRFLGTTKWPWWGVQNPSCPRALIKSLSFSFSRDRSLYLNKSFWTDKVILSISSNNNSHGKISEGFCFTVGGLGHFS